MLTWLKDNGTVIGALAGVLVAFAAILQLIVVGPMNRHFDAQDRRIDDLSAVMNQRFDQQDKYINARFEAVDQRFDAVDQRFDQQDKYMNARFDAQDERLDLLALEVAELRALIVGIIERVSRNEGQIDFLIQQTAPSPSP